MTNFENHKTFTLLLIVLCYFLIFTNLPHVYGLGFYRLYLISNLITWHLRIIMPTKNACVLCLRSVNKNPGLSLFGFPKDSERLKIWLLQCGLNESDVQSNRKLCSFHFVETDFGSGVKRRSLKSNAIPTVFEKESDIIVMNYNETQSTSFEDTQLFSREHLSSAEQESYKLTLISAEDSVIVENTPKKVKRKLLKSNAMPTELLINDETPSTSFEDTQCFNHEYLSSLSNTRTKQGDIELMSIIETPKKSRRKFYVGDIKTPDLATPKRAKRHFNTARLQIISQRNKIKKLHQTVRRLRNQLTSLQKLIDHLKNINLISEHAHDDILNNTSEEIKDVLNRSIKSKNEKYSPKIRSFAITLQFYSAKAYNYVRKTFKNLLPHPATIKKWFSVVDGEPGFTSEAFEAIRKKVNETPGSIVCNITLDEMAIRKQTIYHNGKFYGGIDLGAGQDQNDSDNTQQATNALVFLAVCMNGHWKVPLGYFLVHSLTGNERANLLTKCLELFADTGAKCFSITFDGAPSNIAMCKSLSANFDYFSANFQPWFYNPAYPISEKIKVFIFWDACHMIKLVRNTLGDKKVLVINNGETIEWNHLISLQNIQETKGLHAANKIKKTHIHYYENKMNVRLAVQTLSSSVSSALLFCDELNLISGSKATAEFCKFFNDAFDILNCRNKLAKGDYSIPTNDKTVNKIQNFLDEFKLYVENLRFPPTQKYPEGEQVIKSQRKTGFLGLIICLTNLLELYEQIKVNIDYMLSYKLSQDHLEVFYSAMRSKGGFNNNPNAIQFRSAYKRLLVRHQIEGSMYGNCSPLDSAVILFVGSNKRKDADAICDYEDIDEEQHLLFKEFEHDYDETTRMPELEEFIIDIVKYTGGFIVRKIRKKKNLCEICDLFLTEKNGVNESLLLKLKTRGKLIHISPDVLKICLAAEYVIRFYSNDLFRLKNIKMYLTIKTLNEISTDSTIFNNNKMKQHILNQDPLNNHRSQLIKYIIEPYVSLRLHHIAKMHSISMTDKKVRHSFTKLILFKNQ